MLVLCLLAYVNLARDLEAEESLQRAMEKKFGIKVFEPSGFLVTRDLDLSTNRDSTATHRCW